MNRNYIMLVSVLIVVGSLFSIGCTSNEVKDLSYEIISYESAPKEVQDGITEYELIEEERTTASGNFDFGKEKYIYFMTNEGRKTKIISIQPDETYGRGIMIKHTDEDDESIKFPDNITIVKLNDYYGHITKVFISNP